MSKIKLVHVAISQVYVTKGRNSAVIKPGTEISHKDWLALPSDHARAKFETVEKNVGRARFQGGKVTDLPVVDGVVKMEFAPDELHLLPLSVREIAEEVANLWGSAIPEIPFPGVALGKYGGSDELTWWICGGNLPENAPPMWSTRNIMCRLGAKKDRRPGAYPFATASLLKVRERLIGGRPVFATYEEAIDRLLAA
jgi:hypothetical protein